MWLLCLYSLKYLNVPMVTIFKNLTNVLIMWGEYYFYGQPVTSGAMWSCVVMIIGAMLAAANDITFNGQVSILSMWSPFISPSHPSYPRWVRIHRATSGWAATASARPATCCT
jgi:GDP-mannose transporter